MSATLRNVVFGHACLDATLRATDLTADDAGISEGCRGISCKSWESKGAKR
jgi:hypothetical protein